MLYRLTWQRVWLLSPWEEFDTVAKLAWRPDGKLLAVCYEYSKLLCIVDIETKNIIHRTILSMDLHLTVCVNWLLHKNYSLTSNELTGDYLQCLPKLISNGTETKYKEFLPNTLDILYVCITKHSFRKYSFYDYM